MLISTTKNVYKEKNVIENNSKHVILFLNNKIKALKSFGQSTWSTMEPFVYRVVNHVV